MEQLAFQYISQFIFDKYVIQFLIQQPTVIAKLYIDSEDSTIKVEGGPSDVLHLLVCAIAQILKSYFPDDFERQMGWASGLLYNTIRALKEEDDDED